MALIHASNEDQLLNQICRIIVGAGGYRMAWVGYVEHDANHTVRPVAHSGYEPGFMEHTDMSWADQERGRGPLGIAMREREIQVVQDVNTDPRFEPWRANAAKLGYGSVLVAPLLSDSQLIGALSIHAEGSNAFDAAEIALLGELAADMAFGIVTLRTRNAHQQSATRLQHSMEATIQVISNTLELRDPHSAGHQRRVTELSAAIARHLGLSEDRVRGVHLAGAVHDLGRIQIPADILSKPGKLSRIEFELVKTHPEAGYEILKSVDFPWPIARIVVQHHERLDGSGYPRGLRSGELLLESQIIAVADVVEAMASHRPYRPALGVDRALEEISAKAGTGYDPDVVRACIALFRDKGFAFRD
jgi:HD-GYP domain-containing protein (c-di-GMP phosphodiesterase class II)